MIEEPEPLHWRVTLLNLKISDEFLSVQNCGKAVTTLNRAFPIQILLDVDAFVEKLNENFEFRTQPPITSS